VNFVHKHPVFGKSEKNTFFWPRKRTFFAFFTFFQKTYFLKYATLASFLHYFDPLDYCNVLFNERSVSVFFCLNSLNFEDWSILRTLHWSLPTFWQQPNELFKTDWATQLCNYVILKKNLWTLKVDVGARCLKKFCEHSDVDKRSLKKNRSDEQQNWKLKVLKKKSEVDLTWWRHESMSRIFLKKKNKKKK
jgi:hypothetical protein